MMVGVGVMVGVNEIVGVRVIVEVRVRVGVSVSVGVSDGVSVEVNVTVGVKVGIESATKPPTEASAAAPWKQNPPKRTANAPTPPIARPRPPTGSTLMTNVRNEMAE